MAYASVSTGYKGVASTRVRSIRRRRCKFEPETLTAYEVGTKTNLFDNHMRLNISAFYNNYKDIQLTLSVCPTPPLNGVQYPPAPCALPANVGSAHVKGAEIETEIHPITGWEIDASGSWLDFGYTEITNPNTGITRDMVTPYTPKWKWSVGTQYEAQLGDFGSLTPRVDVSHNAAQFSNAINSTDWNRIDAYTILNASLDVALEGSGLAGLPERHQRYGQAVLPDAVRYAHFGGLFERPAGDAAAVVGDGEAQLLGQKRGSARPKNVSVVTVGDFRIPHHANRGGRLAADVNRIVGSAARCDNTPMRHRTPESGPARVEESACESAERRDVPARARRQLARPSVLA